MIQNHFSSSVFKALGFEPTQGQFNLIQSLTEFVLRRDQDQIFLLKGYAGTGKTSVISALVKTLDQFKIRSILLAPTGRAAKVISTYSGKTALTIHKKIYRQKSSYDIGGQFNTDRNLHTNTIFIVDEASMIANSGGDSGGFGTGRLLDDLMMYVYNNKNCKLILVGDTAQLPPVGLSVSPALSKDELQFYGKEVVEYELMEVVRQKQDSGILHNATNIRMYMGEEGEENQDGYFPLETQEFSDIERVSGGELIDKIGEDYDRYGNDEVIVITRSNKRANQFNEGIRRTILYREEEISQGDLLMVVKNNYFWLDKESEIDFIANGDIAQIVRIKRFEEMYGHRFVNVTLRFLDYKKLELDCKIFLDTLTSETPSLTREQSQKLYEEVSADYQDLTTKQKRWLKIKENEYFNALQVKFAYAVTCHKAQGGQWSSVFLDQGYLTEEMLNRDYLRWMYTGCTRPTQTLKLVNFNDEFFEEE